MKQLELLKRLWRCESGAVTVEWVVLTAGIVALALAIRGPLEDAISGMAENIATSVSESSAD